MNDFNKRYIALLRKQVEDEIQFLITNGHDNEIIYTPCMFCIERPNEHYVCRRLIDLKRFLSSIVSHESSKLRAQHERKPIGFESEAEQYVFGNSNRRVSHSELPLLDVKL